MSIRFSREAEMLYRKLGKSGIKVSEIGFGAWQIGGGFGKQDDAEGIACIHRAMELGVNFIDTAAVYGDGHSEKLIGKAVAGRRQSVAIASKIPPKIGRQAIETDSIKQVFPVDWIVEITERSLANLKIDCLDLQQLHSWTPAFLHQTDWVEGFQKLKKQGKIKSFGVSANDWDPYGATELTQSGLIDSVQVIYNIFEQRPAEKLLSAAIEAKVGIIARVPFEEGLLTGNFGPEVKMDPTDWRSKWLTPERRREAASRVDALKPFLKPDRPTLAALALKFCLSHPAVSTVIPGMRRLAHVDSNCAVSDGKLLSPDEQKALEKHKFVHGWPYPWAVKQS
jgi:aryl-alcohol dehydrogenase-like predicted oxidoreductase